PDRARPMEEDRGDAGQGRGTRGAARVAAHAATAGFRAFGSGCRTARTTTANADRARFHTGECQPARSLADAWRGQVRSRGIASRGAGAATRRAATRAAAARAAAGCPGATRTAPACGTRPSQPRRTARGPREYRPDRRARVRHPHQPAIVAEFAG